MAAKFPSAVAERRMRWLGLVTGRVTKTCPPHPETLALQLSPIKMPVAIPLEQKLGCSAAGTIDP